MSDKYVEQAVWESVILPSVVVIVLFAILMVIASISLYIWYSLLAIMGSYAVVDILMGTFIKGDGQNHWFFLWGNKRVNLATAYMLFVIGVVLTGLDAGFFVLIIKRAVDQGFNLQAVAFPVNLGILGLLLLDFGLVYVRSQDHPETSQPK